MNKFRKILLLAVALVVIVTAFTVTALATDSEAPAEKLYYEFASGTKDFESTEANTEIGSNPNGQGGYMVVQSPYGDNNKYLETHMAAGATDKTSYVGMGYGNTNSAYKFSQYPYAAFDFDYMKTGEDYSSLSFSVYINIGTGTSRPYSPTIHFDSFKHLLPQDAYVWTHLTILFELYDYDEENYRIRTHVYANGKSIYTLDPTPVTRSASNIPKTGTYNDTFEFSADTMFYTEFRFGNGNGSVDADKINVSGSDNFRVTYFNTAYTPEEIATFVYTDDYELPFGKTVATIGETQYDSIYKAMDAASEDDVIVLADNIADTVWISKAVTIDSNGYSLTLDSEAGYKISNDGNGVYTSEKVESYNVIWDPVCAEDCTCDTKHKLSDTNVVIAGEVPEYNGDTTFETVNGYEIILLGWSYENDNTVDELVAATAEQVTDGAITLYPVYQKTQYTYEVIVGGASYFFLEDYYDEAFAKAYTGSSARMILHTDVDTYGTVFRVTKAFDFTLDLNGKVLKRTNAYGDVYAATKDAETGEYTYGTEVLETTTAGTNGTFMFYLGKGGTKFNVISSKPGAKIYTPVMNAKIYVDQETGKIVKAEGIQTKESSFVNVYGAITVNLENFEIYTSCFIYASHASTAQTITVENCKAYRIIGQNGSLSWNCAFISIASYKPETSVHIKNTLLYDTIDTISYGHMIYIRKENANYSTIGDIVFENCDIVGNNKSVKTRIQADGFDSNVIKFNDCRLYRVSNSSTYGYTLGDGSMMDAACDAKSFIANGCAQISKTNTKTYEGLPAISYFDIDENGNLLLDFETIALEATYTYEIIDSEKDGAPVIDDMMFSMAYFTEFKYFLYVPVTDEYTVSKISGFTKEENTVRINSVEYYVFTKVAVTSQATYDIPANVTFTKDGVTYVNSFSVNAFVYADTILRDENSADDEKLVVANMMRFILKAVDSNSDKKVDTKALINTLIGTDGIYTLPEFGTYESDIEDSNIDALSAYISSINFVITSGKASYKLTCTAENSATTSNLEVYLGDEKLTLTPNSKTKTTYLTVESQRVYDIIAPITIKVIEADGNELVATYSILENINATGADLVKALYEFAVSAKAYRENRTDY